MDPHVTDWSLPRHAYGAAGDVPGLLAEARALDEDEGGVWDELWGRLCHQGTVYSASYAALPALKDMSVQRAPAGYTAPLHLAAAIISSNDGPEAAAVVRHRYRAELGVLRDVAERNLDHASGDVEFVYGLQTLMAFEDGGVWQRNLQSIADGELSLECPQCGADLLMPLDGPTFVMTSFDDDSLAPTQVIPTELADSDEDARLLTLTRAHGQEEIAAKLAFLFGRATCPSCGTAFRIRDALA